MRRRRLVAALCAALVVGLMLAPAVALARPGGGHGGGRGHGGGGRGHHGGGHHGGGHHRGGHGGHHGGFRHHRHHGHHGFHQKGHHRGHGFFSSCCSGVVYTAPGFYSPLVYPSAAYSYPPALSYGVDYAPPVYAASYQPTPVYASGSVTVAPASPSVIEYPHGRYELRGDGMRTPYTWVWIPNPPPAPPPAAPPPPAGPPPAVAPSPAPPASDAPRPSSRDRLYRWTDEVGVVHWTNRPDTVPAGLRTQSPASARP